MKKKLLIVYHSQSGATAQLAAAVRIGATREEDIEIKCVRAWDTGVEQLLYCDGLLLGFPENSGALAGSMKDYLDRIYYPLQSCAMIKPFALFTSAGNDGRGAVQQAQRIMQGMPMKEVVAPLICRGPPTPAALEQCEELGHTLAAGLALGIY